MRLTELEPRWIAHRDNPNALFVFRCPHCRKTWLTCTLIAIPTREQFEILSRELPGNGGDVIGCKPAMAWAAEHVPDFERLTITPSIDASKSGHWHGHITDGAIK